jgi:hypothetical protein
MNAITKAGTNAIHGDAFEFLRNDTMDARNFFVASKSELRRNQFGYAVGGPFGKTSSFGSPTISARKRFRALRWESSKYLRNPSVRDSSVRR